MKNIMFNSIISIFSTKMTLLMLCCLGVFAHNITAQCVVLFDQCTTDIYIYDCDNSGDEVINWVTPNAVTNGPCQGFSIAQVSGPAPGTLVGYGQYTVSYYAYAFDIGTGANPSATCTFTVHVIADNAPPVFQSCPPDITVYTADPTGVNVYWTVPIVFDNCGTAISLTTDMPCPAILPWGVHQIEYLAVDAAGNASTCSFTVTVLNSLMQRTAAGDETTKINPAIDDRSNNSGHANTSLEQLFKLRPNPVSDLLIIESNLEAGEKTDVYIYDVFGTPVLATKWPKGAKTIDIPVKNLIPGIYFINILPMERKAIKILKVVKI